MHPINVSFYSGSQTLSPGLLWLILAAVELLSLSPLSYPLENKTYGFNHHLFCFAPFFTLHRNYLQAPCTLMEALSRDKEGNHINCMSANRITSSLTRHESELKLITHARKNGRPWLGRQSGAGACPSQRGLLPLHTQANLASNLR